MAVSVQLVKESKFPMKFTTLEDANDSIGGGATAEVLECKLDIAIRSTDELLAEINDEKRRNFSFNPKLTAKLRQVLKKALAIRSVVESDDTISASIRLNYLNSCHRYENMTAEICLSGGFLSNVSAECKLPIFAALKFEIFNLDKDKEVSWAFFQKICSPSITEQGDCVFKFVGTCHSQIFTADTKFKGCLSIDLRLESPVPYWSTDRITLPPVSELLRSILTEQIESDFELIAESGKRFPCHKVFLAANSKVLARMLQTDCEETKERKCKMTLSEYGMKAFLAFLYSDQVCGVSMSIQNSGCALELLEAANKYNIVALHVAIKEVFLNQSIEWMDVDVAVMLYLYTLRVNGNEDLKWKAIQALKSKPDELVNSEPFDELLKKDVNTAKEMIRLTITIKTGSAIEAPLRKKLKR